MEASRKAWVVEVLAAALWHSHLEGAVERSAILLVLGRLVQWLVVRGGGLPVERAYLLICM